MHELRTHPEADAELEETLRYLSENSLWQATRFADSHHAALLKIQNNPKSCHFVHHDYRRCQIRPFSHSIIYRERMNDVYVIAIRHDKRHPDYWKTRIPEDPT